MDMVNATPLVLTPDEKRILDRAIERSADVATWCRTVLATQDPSGDYYGGPPYIEPTSPLARAWCADGHIVAAYFELGLLPPIETASDYYTLPLIQKLDDWLTKNYGRGGPHGIQIYSLWEYNDDRKEGEARDLLVALNERAVVE